MKTRESIYSERGISRHARSTRSRWPENTASDQPNETFIPSELGVRWIQSSVLSQPPCL